MTTPNTWIEPPPRKGMGCFAKGCLILFAFTALLIVALVAGGVFAVRKVKTEFLPGEPLPMPPVQYVESEIRSADERWDTFVDTSEAGQPARIELTEKEVNDLLAADPDTRGRFYVTLSENTGKLQISIPLKDVPFLNDRYLNAAAVVAAGADKTIPGAEVRQIQINGRDFSNDVLDWQYQSKSVRGAAEDFAKDQNITLFDIVDGKLILEANSPR